MICGKTAIRAQSLSGQSSYKQLNNWEMERENVGSSQANWRAKLANAFQVHSL